MRTLATKIHVTMRINVTMVHYNVINKYYNGGALCGACIVTFQVNVTMVKFYGASIVTSQIKVTMVHFTVLPL